MLTVASHWSKKHNVSVFWDEQDILKRAKERFGLDLTNIKITRNFFRGNNLFKKIFASRRYDLILFLSDGSIPTSFARFNILHFQTPFQHIQVPRWKLSRYQAIVCNSAFTQRFLAPSIAARSVVIYPPVPMIGLGKKKEKIILSVGRFAGHFQAKKQEILIEAFKHAIHTSCLQGWKLILAGGLLRDDEKYFRNLIGLAKGNPIEFLPNATFEALSSLYRRASFYWHAAGYGENNPQNQEHFGITTVEAMSAGCVPFSYRAGGQTEIIESGKNGFLWNTQDELLDQTQKVIRDNKLYERCQKAAVHRANNFSEAEFCTAFDALRNRITSL